MAETARKTREEGISQPESLAPPPVTPLRREPARTRLVVELSPATAAELDELVETEGVNKTTVVNRAVQFYNFIRDAERNGSQILLLEKGAKTPQKILFFRGSA